MFIYNADTGCTDTMVKSKASLESSFQISPTPIYMANNTTIKATAIGPIRPPISLPPIPALVLPGLAENLLSVDQLSDNGVTSVFTKDRVQFFKSPVHISGVKLGEGKRVNKKYFVQPITANHASTYSASLLTWHLHLSHLGETSIQRFHAQGVTRVTDWDRKGLKTCQACKEGCMPQRKFSSREGYCASWVLGVIHSDVCTLSHRSHNGFVYFVTFINDFSKYAVFYLFQFKSQVFESFVHFARQVEQETGCKVVDSQSDNSGEYISNRMKARCTKYGIKQTMGPPHTPKLNGVAERYNRTLLDRLKPSFKNSSLPKSDWSDALS